MHHRVDAPVDDMQPPSTNPMLNRLGSHARRDQTATVHDAVPPAGQRRDRSIVVTRLR
jgi:hypothetical protein